MKHSFMFTRQEGLHGITAAAVLTISTEGPAATTHEEAFDRFKKAVSDWLRETEAGHSAWERSVQNFNIADFISDVDRSAPEFVERLERHGVTIHEADTVAWDQHVEFDKVLHEAYESGDDLIGKIARATGSRCQDWEGRDGPDSGVGVDYWFEHTDGCTAYVNVDQGEVSIQISQP